MRKGFTLIELLAVIVILAIIALIATPIVLEIINDSKNSTILSSAEFYLNALENEIMLENMKQGGTFNLNECTIDSGRVLCGTKEINLKIDGETPTRGNVIFENGKVTNVNFSYKGNNIVLNNEGQLVFADIPESKSFAEDSWDTIAANVRIGNISKYKVGDTKEIILTSEDTDIAGTYLVRIANISTPEECKQKDFSQTACGFVVEFANIISKHSMNPIDSSAGGWESSEMRNYINNDILNSFPEDLKKNIINTYVVSGHEKNKTDNYETTDKLYLLSTTEIYRKEGTSNLIDYDSAEVETRQLDYYKSIGVTTDSNIKTIKDKSWWWMRTAYSNGSRTFYHVDSIGKLNYDLAYGEYGVSVAFRL